MNKGIVSLSLLGLALAFGTPAQAALIATVSGNDCAGVLGSSFRECAYNGSPIIAKFNANGGGTGLQVAEINTAAFPGITGAEFSVSGSGSSGSWTYTPGAGDPLISYVVAKAGNAFNIFSADALNSASWFTPTNPNNGKPFGLSHLSFFGTGPGTATPPATAVPEPASLALFGVALLGLGLVRRRRGQGRLPSGGIA